MNMVRIILSYSLILLLSTQLVKAQVIPQESCSLPSLVIAYASHCQFAMDAKGNAAPLPKYIRRIDKEFNELECDLSSRMVFTNYVYQFQTEIDNQFIGYHSAQFVLPEQEFEHGRSLFVSSPIEEIDGGVLVLVSSTSPARTTLFSLNPHLEASLMYDSDLKNSVTIQRGNGNLGAILSIRNLGDHIFLLTEARDRSLPPDEPCRKFILKVLNEEVHLTQLP